EPAAAGERGRGGGASGRLPGRDGASAAVFLDGGGARSTGGGACGAVTGAREGKGSGRARLGQSPCPPGVITARTRLPTAPATQSPSPQNRRSRAAEPPSRPSSHVPDRPAAPAGEPVLAGRRVFRSGAPPSPTGPGRRGPVQQRTWLHLVVRCE